MEATAIDKNTYCSEKANAGASWEGTECPYPIQTECNAYCFLEKCKIDTAGRYLASDGLYCGQNRTTYYTLEEICLSENAISPNTYNYFYCNDVPGSTDKTCDDPFFCCNTQCLSYWRNTTNWPSFVEADDHFCDIIKPKTNWKLEEYCFESCK